MSDVRESDFYLIVVKTTEDETFSILSTEPDIARAAKLATQLQDDRDGIGYVTSVEVIDVTYEEASLNPRRRK